ncbi:MULTISPECIES: amidohydrolase family protein [unclassified Sphingobium]|uniref:metal-dependent hydrolase family protein n=1 Tax=unclassified Sphingobium TaxID=2611147 RepID=UPI0035A664D0
MARLILANGALLDGESGPRQATVIVEGDRFAEVADAAGPPITPRPGDRVIDLGGRTVMPGMVLGHYHASYFNIGASLRPFGLEAPPALQAIRAVKNFRTTLDCGFTGVISAGAPNGIDPALKAAVAEGNAVGPRIMTCGRDVSTTGHFNDLSYPSYLQIGASGAMVCCDGPEGFRRAVRQEMKDGAEIIKIFATGGHGVPISGQQTEITPEELDMAIRTARERGGKVRAHLANRDAILCAIELGLHIVDHGDGFDDACIEASVRHGTFLTPSLHFAKTIIQMAPGTDYAEAMRADYDAMLAVLGKANAAGVGLLLGDDYGATGLDHGSYGREFRLYVEEAGIPALDVIRWATVHGAAAMGLENECGRVRAGMLADFLVVDGDPLTDLDLLADPGRLLAIFKGGVAHKDQLDQLATGGEDAGRASTHSAGAGAR